MKIHLLTPSATLELFKTTKQGLHHSEVEERLKQYGSNELKGKHRKTTLILILNQFKDVMIIILLLAAIVSFYIGDLKDAIVILIIVLLNAIIGFIQEYRAEKTIEALRKMATSFATVRRNGNLSQVPATELVPGDIVLLEAGMSVPADIRLTETHHLKVEEATLTGESKAIEKTPESLSIENLSLGDCRNMVYKSTIVVKGRAEGIVVATGMQTEIGRIAQLLEVKETKTPLQKRLADFGKKLSLIIVFVCLIIYGTGLLSGENPVKMLLTAISIAVAAIPEALPAVITISLALGANKLARRNALIRKLSAVETLGSVTYICSDKTGTITQNKMMVTEVFITPEIASLTDYTSEQLFLLAMELNHDVKTKKNHHLIGDPTEIALVEYTRMHKSYNKGWIAKYKRTNELPFDSTRKRMTTIYQYEDKWIIISKGAIESILTSCQISNAEDILTKTENYARQGKRVLAYSFKIVLELPQLISVETIENNMTFIGLASMIDPPRPEAIKAISSCYTAGITPVMITGDHPVTAMAIATEAGIVRHPADKIITGSELSELTDEEFEKEIEYIKVYARVSPEQKLKIVKTLQRKNHFVAMTGDGVNDAPALKQANIGIAMGITGSDVSKEAAHMILLDDNFATIIGAVKEGRRIFDNILKFIKYSITGNCGKIWTLFLAPIIGLPTPLLPIQILWLNLITDGLPGLAFVAEPEEEDILRRPPRKPEESVFSKGMWYYILWVGLLMGGISVAAQSWAIHIGNDKWMTIVFTILSFTQMGLVLAVRSDKKSLFSQEILGNKPLIGAVILSISLQLAVVYLPFLQDIFSTQSLNLKELMICIGLSSIVFWAVEIEKWYKRIQARKLLENKE